MKTNETQWTPGPWATPPMPRCGSDLGIMTNPANGRCQVVAMVVVDEDYPQEDAEQWANARLIAAAPEMAELLAELTLDLTVPIMARGKCALLLAKIKGTTHA